MTSPTELWLSDALHDIAGAQPFEPDPIAIERRGRHLRRRTAALRVAGAGVAVAVALVVAPYALNRQPAAAPTTHLTTAEQSLAPLLAYLRTAPKPTGDATLTRYDDTDTDGRSNVGWELYGDNGTSYGALKLADLPAQITGHRGEVLRGFNRMVAIAAAAATGDLTAARHRLAKVTSATDDPSLIDGQVWENSSDLLLSAGDPVVRLGLLRLISTLPELTVTKTTTEGQATLTLTVTAPIILPLHKTPPVLTDAMVVNAHTGMPVASHGADQPGLPTIDSTIQISRVTLADVAAGKL